MSDVKTYIVQVKLPGTRITRRTTIGRANVLSLKVARERAAAVLAEIALGTDPKAKRLAEAAARLTFGAALDAYLADLACATDRERPIGR